MNIRTATLATLAALTLAVGLAGCAGSTTSDDSFGDGDVITDRQVSTRTYSTTFELATGKVVKVSADDTTEPLYVDPAYETMDESALLSVGSGKENPLELPGATDDYIEESDASETSGNRRLAPPSMGPFLYGFDMMLESTIIIEDKGYSVTASSRASASMTADQAVAYYNTYVATPIEVGTDLLAQGTLGSLIQKNLASATKSVTLANISYITSGASLINKNDGVASDWAGRVPAWQAYRNMQAAANDTSVPAAPPQSNQNVAPSDGSNSSSTTLKPDYFYSFACATYDVALVNGAATLEAINAQLGDTVQLNDLTNRTTSVLVESAAPCNVIKFQP